jgi:biotin carboxylase
VKSVLLVAATTGYQTRAFEAAAHALGVALVYATDRCDRLDDPWRDGAVAVSFSDPDRATRTIVDALQGAAPAGVLALGDGAAVIAAQVAEAIGLPWHTAAGARIARDKLLARGRLLAAGMPVPWFVAVDVGEPLELVADRIRFPCVVKPAALSASRGVMRADDPAALASALARLERLLRGSPDTAGPGGAGERRALIEGFISGREYALEGVMDHGVLHVLAIFDKPDPLDGPYFEETIYVTPPALPEPTQRAMGGVIGHGAHAFGLIHGPVHAECRLNAHGIFVLEIAARPIGGLCARSLQFRSPASGHLSLEELLLRHAVGESLEGCALAAGASGVMMIPVPRRGHFRHAEGLDAARALDGIEDVVITAKPGQLLEPWPEGHTYPGFIFARAPMPEQVVTTLRRAHATLRFDLNTSLPLVSR